MPQTRAAIKTRSARQEIGNSEGQEQLSSQGRGKQGRTARGVRGLGRAAAPVLFKSNSAGKLRAKRATAGS